MIDLIVLSIVVVILACAVGYIIRAKKRGVKCIGCSSCPSHSKKEGACNGSCHCHE